MQSKKKILLRTTVLYIILFVIVILSAVFSFDELINTSQTDAMRIYSAENRSCESTMAYDMKVTTVENEFDTPLYSSPDGSVHSAARASSMDVEIVTPAGHTVGRPALTLSLSFVVLGCYIAIFVIIFIILTSLRRSIITGDVFDKRIIIHTRVIGMLLIVASLTLSLSTFIESRAVAPYFAGSNYLIDTSFNISFQEILMGILIFVIAEIFAIGNRISQEQKLTI